jgi:hypothetical protein
VSLAGAAGILSASDTYPRLLPMTRDEVLDECALLVDANTRSHYQPAAFWERFWIVDALARDFRITPQEITDRRSGPSPSPESCSRS